MRLTKRERVNLLALLLAVDGVVGGGTFIACDCAADVDGAIAG